ncbi:PREDICTED: uncharacterized protein LOC100638564 [Amphimedon queenslandica]|uniref:DDE-1 domain-containing protein n=1 Tax=Amphimedon queenslandica TaxID=400682 RepID=A0A1X7TX51_AMPQE|nr:PREDICTED: uncharacterized protein LOC100638564 [Amphimedon queenslandica]|eukprot:XP_011406640.1 PREDICTED: uncharacterized protein LOC100638564 [Amphimedon queenslandica]
MTGEILNQVLKSLNSKLKAQSRSILLLMDNAGCHPNDISEKFSQIKVVFLPPNTTSKLQPLDLGIIMAFKIYYRKLLMQYILAKIDSESSNTAHDIAKGITILQAIRWISQAWGQVQEETIKKCFRKAGILVANLSDIVARSTLDPFSDLDDDNDESAGRLQELPTALVRHDPSHDTEMDDLITRLHLDGSCSSKDLLLADDNIAICEEFNNDNWEEEFLSGIDIGQSASKARRVDDDQDVQEDEDPVDEEPDQVTPPVIKEMTEAINKLEDIVHFLEFNGYTEEATEGMSFLSKLNITYVSGVSKGRQTEVTDYFMID